MDRMRPVYVRQKSGGNTPGPPTSPMMSPMHHHGRSGSVGMGGAKKAQHTKAAAQRLAHVMANKPTEDDDEDDDDLSYDLSSLSSSTGSIGLAGGRSMRPRSPMVMGLWVMFSCQTLILMNLTVQIHSLTRERLRTLIFLMCCYIFMNIILG